METEYDIFEIVVVIRGFWLIDAESYQRMYCTNLGEPLTPGYYVVNWPEHIRVRRFNEYAAFYGPFKLRNEAQTALIWMSQEREHFLAMSSEVSTVEPPDSSRMKAITPERRLAGAKTRPRITRFPPPDYQNHKSDSVMTILGH